MMFQLVLVPCLSTQLLVKKSDLPRSRSIHVVAPHGCCWKMLPHKSLFMEQLLCGTFILEHCTTYGGILMPLPLIFSDN